MRYVIFEDPLTKTFHAVLVSNYVDPLKISIDGMRLTSGGDVSLAPDAKFTVQPSEFCSYDESDPQFVGAAIGGLDESEFRKKKPVLLFKLANDSTLRKAYSMAELLETPGFPDMVSWVSQAIGTPEFDRFFEVTEDGVSVRKQAVPGNSIEDNTDEYLEMARIDPSGISGTVIGDIVSSSKRGDITEIEHSPESSYVWLYSPRTEAVYWFSDAGTRVESLVSEHLLEGGHTVSKHAVITLSMQ
jgi:hypothetical protein